MKRSNAIYVLFTVIVVLKSVNSNLNDHTPLRDRLKRSHNTDRQNHHGLNSQHVGRNVSQHQHNPRQTSGHQQSESQSNVRMNDRDQQNRNAQDYSQWYNGESRYDPRHHHNRHGNDQNQRFIESSRQSHDHHHGNTHGSDLYHQRHNEGNRHSHGHNPGNHHGSGHSQQRQNEGNRQNQNHHHDPYDYSAWYTEERRHSQGQHQLAKDNGTKGPNQNHTVTTGSDGHPNKNSQPTGAAKDSKFEIKTVPGTVNRSANISQEAREAALNEFKEIRFPLITAPQRVCPDGQRRDRSNNCRAIFK